MEFRRHRAGESSENRTPSARRFFHPWLSWRGWMRVFVLGNSSFEPCQQLIRSHGGSADLADHDAGGMIGKDGSLHWRSPGGNGEGESGDDRIARARDVEDFLGERRDVERFAVPL